jgi:hypothetical protein
MKDLLLMTDKRYASELQNLDTQTPNGTLGEKLHNELYVLGNGISQSVAGIEHAAEKALHDPATIVKVG